MKKLFASLFVMTIVLSVTPATARPAEWCGWYMRQVEGVHDKKYDRAQAWLEIGTPVSGPMIGAIVVWKHRHGHGHVGKIVGRNQKGWLVLSGNDGGRVRTRVRNLSRAQFRLHTQVQYGMI